MTTLGYALLGLVARHKLSGYDIASWMRDPIGFFWTASHSQIYPELARLKRQRLVTHETIPQQGRPTKKVYTITDKGRAVLQAWVVEPPSERVSRDEFVLKTFSLWTVEPQAARALFQMQLELHKQRLQLYQDMRVYEEEKRGDELRRIDSPAWASYATLQRGIGYEREYVAWCEWVLAELDRAINPTKKRVAISKSKRK